MPLSDHEQRLLEQMERALYAEDPKFAVTLRAGSTRADKRRAALGILVLLAGIGLLIGGVMAKFAILGAAGFVVMLVGATIAYSGFRGRPEPEAPAPGSPAEAASGKRSGKSTSGPAAQGKSSGGFMDKMEERWRRRKESGEA